MFSTLNNWIQFILALAGIISSIISAYFLIVNFSASHFANVFSDRVFGYDSYGKREFKKRFRRYIKGHYVLNRNSVSYRKLYKGVRDKKIYVVFGDVGSGKTSLMQHLSFSFRKKTNNKFAHTLSDYDIAYIRAVECENVDEIIDKLKDKDDKDEYTVFIDGLDELQCYLKGEIDSESLTIELFEKIKRNELIRKNRRIFISMRTETLPGGITSLNALQNAPDIITIKKFNQRQVTDLYKKTAKDRKTPRKQQKENIAGIKQLFSEQKDNILCNPFIATWIDEIFGNASKVDIESKNYYAIIRSVIDKNMEREADLLKENFINELDYDNQRDSLAKEYIKNAYVVLKLIALTMAENQQPIVTRSDINRIIEKYNELDVPSSVFDNNENTIKSRRLLHYTPATQERKNETYEFMHNLIYAYLISNALITEPDSYPAVRKQYISAIRKNPGNSAEVKMYLSGVYCECKDSLRYIKLSDFLTDVTENRTVKHKKGSLSVEKLITLLKEFISTVVLDNEKALAVYTIEEMQTERALDLSGLSIDSCDTAAEFDLAGYDSINLSNNKLKKINFETGIKALDVTENPITVANIESPVGQLDISANKESDIATSPTVKKYHYI